MVARAVRSVLSQEGADLEVLVVDDGSTDGTHEAVREIARGDPRLHLLAHERRRGAQSARNTGIRAARGAWIAFLDSDDEWLPGSLAVRMAAAAREGAEAVHSECDVVRHPDAARRPFGIPPMAGMVYGELLRRPGPAFPGLLVRTSALERIGGLDEAIVSYQEWDTAIRLARESLFAFVPEPTFIYHCHAGETISGEKLRQAAGYEQVVIKHRGEIRRVAGRDALARHFETAARFYGEGGDRRSSRRCTTAAIASRPFCRDAARRLLGLTRGL